MWSWKKSSLHHIRVWGCRAEIKSYNPQTKKLDLKTISAFFVGYCFGSRGSRFYCSSHATKIVESNRVVYFEDETSIIIHVAREISFGKEHIIIHFPAPRVSIVNIPIVQDLTFVENESCDQIEPSIHVDGVPLRRSLRVCKPAISNDYMIY